MTVAAPAITQAEIEGAERDRTTVEELKRKGRYIVCHCNDCSREIMVDPAHVCLPPAALVTGVGRLLICRVCRGKDLVTWVGPKMDGGQA